MKLLKTGALVAIILSLTACASGVSRQAKTADQSTATAVSGLMQAKVTQENPLTDITVGLTDEATQKLGDNLKFNQNELLEHVKRALEANKFYVAKAVKPGMTMEVVVKDIRVRSNFSAIMFGFMAGSDSVTGDIVIKNPNGQEVDRFEVSASYALGGIAGGVDSSRMSWLYENFALETLNEIRAGK